jgi:TRAP transporter TAXI family solute receptor
MIRGHWRRAWSARAVQAAVLTIPPALFLSVAAPGAAEPQKWVRGSMQARLAEATNRNTVAIVSGNLNATYLTIAYDLSAVLDGEALRILPVIGKGGGQNIRDVRYLKGVDLGITQSNLLGSFKRTRELGPLDERIVYIAKLFNEEMHLVVRADSAISAIEQLDGKKVNFSDVGSGTQLSARDVFTRIGIKPIEINVGQADAIEQLKRGDIAATVLIAGKPAASMAKLRAADGFRFLPVAFAKPLQSDYLPATLSAADYPGMIEPGQRLDTIAVGAVLIAYNWPEDSERYKVIEKFVDAFFSKLGELQKPPRHPKWRETNLAATLPGWTRFGPAADWLKEKREKPKLATREQFDAFLAARRSATRAGASASEDREALFREFVKWNEARERH